MFLNKTKRALSFAELIIVLTIIGTIAAMTIPGMKKHSQRTELAAQCKRAYLLLEDAVDNAILTYGPVRSWNMSSNKFVFDNYLLPSLKTSSSVSIDDNNSYAVTPDGMRIQVAECNNSICHFHVDVNGTSRPPNLVGKDNFEFQLNKSDENITPAPHGGAGLLRKNNWKFTDKLWNCDWVKDPNNCGL